MSFNSWITTLLLSSFAYVSLPLAQASEICLTRAFETQMAITEASERIRQPELYGSIVEGTPTLTGLPSAINLKEAGDGEGGHNAGLYLVSAAGLPKLVAKVFTRQYEFNQALVIQKVMGDLGYAPKVRGYVIDFRSSKLGALSRWIAAKINPEGLRVSIMDHIEGAWNVTMSNKIPKFFETYSAEHILSNLRRMREIEGALRVLQINAYDSQFFITPTGEILLGDLDEFRFLKPGDRQADLTSDMVRLVRRWQLVTGKRITPEQFKEATGRDRPPDSSENSYKPIMRFE